MLPMTVGRSAHWGYWLPVDEYHDVFFDHQTSRILSMETHNVEAHYDKFLPGNLRDEYPPCRHSRNGPVLQRKVLDRPEDRYTRIHR